MERLVPLISSSVAGPMGVAHLPRTWLKAILAETDALYEGWNPGYRGFNKMMIDALGIDQEAFFEHIKTLPTYPETERWVEQNAANLDAASIAASNATILGHERPDEKAAPTREQVGLNGSTLCGSAALNDLDDWYTIHRWILAHRGERLDPIIPTISSTSNGPLGAKHLPRLWIKALLNAAGALRSDYNSGCGLDAFAAETLGLDLDAAIAYIHRELPSYVAFETWVSEQLPNAGPRLAEYNRTLTTRLKPEEKAAAERAEAGVPETTIREAVRLNDLVDWKELHSIAASRRSTVA